MKLSLAPIQGMTIAHYRNLYAKIFGGIDEYYAPFIATTDMRKLNPSIFKDIHPEINNASQHTVPQILGNNGVNFRYYASKLVELGYKEINWNIGCPFRPVTKKKKGSGILPYPDMVKSFLDEVCQDSSYDLTVKMRLGMNDLEEGIKVIELLNDYPLSGIIIHGRTGIQKYTGHVDLDAFEVLYTACNHEVTYNGDIFTLDDYNKIQNRFPLITSFMLGRGALKDPFLPSAIKGTHLSAMDKLSKLKEFHDGIYHYYEDILSGERHLCDRMKEFWSYTADGIDQNGQYMKKIKKCHTVSAYQNVVSQMFVNANN